MLSSHADTFSRRGRRIVVRRAQGKARTARREWYASIFQKSLEFPAQVFDGRQNFVFKGYSGSDEGILGAKAENRRVEVLEAIRCDASRNLGAPAQCQ